MINRIIDKILTSVIVGSAHCAIISIIFMFLPIYDDLFKPFMFIISLVGAVMTFCGNSLKNNWPILLVFFTIILAIVLTSAIFCMQNKLSDTWWINASLISIFMVPLPCLFFCKFFLVAQNIQIGPSIGLTQRSTRTLPLRNGCLLRSL